MLMQQVRMPQMLLVERQEMRKINYRREENANATNATDATGNEQGSTGDQGQQSQSGDEQQADTGEEQTNITNATSAIEPNVTSAITGDEQGSTGDQDNNRLEKSNKLKQERNHHCHQLQMPLMLRLHKPQECSMRPTLQVFQMKPALRMTIAVQMTKPETNNLRVA